MHRMLTRACLTISDGLRIQRYSDHFAKVDPKTAKARAAAPVRTRPNIILFLADDLG